MKIGLKLWHGYLEKSRTMINKIPPEIDVRIEVIQDENSDKKVVEKHEVKVQVGEAINYDPDTMRYFGREIRNGNL